MRNLLFAIAIAMLVAGCSTQHPAFAMNSATCATLGPAIATLVSSSPFGIFSSSVIGKAFCDAEASAVAGPPAQVTQTTTTVNGTTKVQ